LIFQIGLLLCRGRNTWTFPGSIHARQPQNVIKITPSLEHRQNHTFTRTIFDKSSKSHIHSHDFWQIVRISLTLSRCYPMQISCESVVLFILYIFSFEGMQPRMQERGESWLFFPEDTADHRQFEEVRTSGRTRRVCRVFRPAVRVWPRVDRVL
jgi:hypothetical protein